MKPTAETPTQDINRAIVLRPLLGGDVDARDPEARLLEAVGLAQALGLDVAYADAAPLRQISPRSYFGEGRVARLKTQAEELGAGVIVVRVIVRRACSCPGVDAPGPGACPASAVIASATPTRPYRRAGSAT